MSIAELVPSSSSKKLQPYQKWYMLFPANWAQLAFDREWRTKRLVELASSQRTRDFSFWGLAGCGYFLLLLNVIAGHVNSTSPADLRSQIITLSLFTTIVFIFAFQCLNYLKLQVEQILLQIIDRLEQEGSRDA
jgi:hypothetical protein